MTRSVPSPARRSVLAAGAAAAAFPLAAGCSIADDSTGSGDGGRTVSVRIWDETVRPAYEESFAAFSTANPGISVRLELVPWASYWDKLPADAAAGTLPDVFWTNSSNFGVYADNGTFLDVTAELPDTVAGFQPSVVEQFTRDGSLWGVPQLSDAIGLFYAVDLVEAAGVDPSALRWDPSGAGDTFRSAARALTDTSGERPRYGFNAAYDLQAIYYNFVGSNGGRWQAGAGADPDAYVYADDPRTVEAVQYVVDLINRDRVAPSAADTNENGDFSRDQFTQGNLALFQSGTYNLKNVADGADFRWAVAPALTGPAGRVTVTNGIVAAGNADTADREATLAVLRWLASEEGSRPVGAAGAAFPAVTAAQQVYLDHWRGQGVDVQPFLDAAAGPTIPAPHGPRAQAGGQAAEPVLQEVFAGRVPVAEGLRRAQEAATAAVAE